jgi:hypothetical protein
MNVVMLMLTMQKLSRHRCIGHPSSVLKVPWANGTLR